MLVITVPEINDAEYILSKVNYEKWCDFNFDIFNCEFSNKCFILLVTGYGKINIASALQTVMCYEEIDAVLQIGTAGSLGELNIYDIFVVDKAVEYTVDFTALGYKAGTLPNETTGCFNSNIYLKQNLIKSINDFDKNYTEGIIATGEEFVSSKNLSSSIKKIYCAKAVDTECGSASNFCYKNEIPFIGIKVISSISFNNAAYHYNLYNETSSLLSQKIALNFIKYY